MLTGSESSGPACWAEPRPWSIDQHSPERVGHEDGVGFRPAAEAAIELPDHLPLPGTLRFPCDVAIVPLRNEQFAVRGATTDAVRRQAAQSLLELGFEVQEQTEPETGPVAGRWKLLLGRQDGVHPSTPGRLVAAGSVRVAATCEGLFDIEAGGDVHIDANVRWHGSVVASGTVFIGDGAILEGNVDASGIVRLADQATVLGRIRCNRIVLGRGARIGGGLFAGRVTEPGFRHHQGQSPPMSEPGAANGGFSNPRPARPSEPVRPASPRAAQSESAARTEGLRLRPAAWAPTPANEEVAPVGISPSESPKEEDAVPAGASVPPEQEWTERAYIEATKSFSSTPEPKPEPQALELVLGVDKQESREFLEALGIRRPAGQNAVLELDLEPDRKGLVLRRRASFDDEYWERRIAAGGHPILESLRDLLLRLGPDTHARAQVQDAGAQLHLGPVDPSRLPGAMKELSGLVSSRTLTSVQAVTERRQ